jgi:hypothetical protein
MAGNSSLAEHFASGMVMSATNTMGQSCEACPMNTLLKAIRHGSKIPAILVSFL